MSPFLDLAADAVLVVHALFILFVVGGQAAIVVGLLRGWGWVRGFWLRVIHLAAIAVVVGQAWVGLLCPLTVWEKALRERAGDTVYSGAFIEHWLGELIFFRAEAWVFTVVYTGFGIIVVATWWLGPPRKRTG